MKKYILKSVFVTIMVATSVSITGCSDNDKHDPGKPVIVNRFYPTTGGAGTEILITGDNFSTNAEDITVTCGGTPLKVLGSDMKNIMAVVPTKLGDGYISVSVRGSEPVMSLAQFTYSFSVTVSTFAGNGQAGYFDGKGLEAMFNFYDPDIAWLKGSLCVDNDCNVYVGDAANYCLRKISPDGTVTTLAGYPGQNALADGISTTARFTSFYGMDIDNNGNIYIIDTTNWKIRKVTPEGEVTTFEEGVPCEPYSLAVDKRNGDIYIGSTNTGAGQGAGIFKWTPDGCEKISDSPTFGIVVDKDGNLYAADQTIHGIVKYDAGTWVPTTIVGNGSTGYVDGAFSDAKFSNPAGLDIDTEGNIYVAGNGLYDGGDNADQSIRILDMKNKIVKTIAGSSTAGFIDANGTSASFSGPLDVAVDKNGIIYVYDKRNNAIRKIIYE